MLAIPARQRFRARRVAVAGAAGGVALLLALQVLQQVRALRPVTPAAAFGAALRGWRAGGVPAAVVAAAAAVGATEVAAVVVASAGGRGVVDVGANKGHPVTRTALGSGVVGFVVSVEPDGRNFGALEALKGTGGVEYFAVKGAAGRERGVGKMRFNRLRDDHTCFGCLDLTKEGVYEEEVEVYTVDGLVGEGGRVPERLRGRGVVLLKTDTQGYEGAVLAGAVGLLRAGVVENVVMEYDVKLFHKREVARAALDVLFRVGMECAALAFAGVPAGGKVGVFGRAVTAETADAFWEFVGAQGGAYTDLFCSKRPVGRVTKDLRR